MAMGGKLVTLKEQAGEAPNGTQFMITTGPAPELDATNLIVGQVRVWDICCFMSASWVRALWAHAQGLVAAVGGFVPHSEMQATAVAATAAVVVSWHGVLLQNSSLQGTPLRFSAVQPLYMPCG